MKLPRDLMPQELITSLDILGYKVSRQKGCHIRITTEINGQHHEVIPNHKPIKIGTLQSILTSIAKHHKISSLELIKILKL